MQAATCESQALSRQVRLAPHVPMLATKQSNAWSKKYCALAHPRATQSPTHDTLTIGGDEVASMHGNAQVSISKQPMVTQSPQSDGQLAHVS
jgi:hypothetical protein